MFKTDKRLTKLYEKYNALYFDNELPSCQVGWSDEMGASDSVGLNLTAECLDIQSHVIALDKTIKTLTLPCQLKQYGTFAKMTLLHEMAHVRLHPYAKHGVKFDEEMLRLAVRGAFDGIW